MVSAMHDNARDLERDLAWFAEVLKAHFSSCFGDSPPLPSPLEMTPPDLLESASPYARFIVHNRLSVSERLVLLLALIPHIRPQLLDPLWGINEATDRGFSEVGGVHGTTHGGFIPTGETAVFLLAGNDLEVRFAIMRLFEGDQLFARQAVLQLAPVAAGEPLLSGPLLLSREYISRFTTASEQKPDFNAEFPARLIETQREWSDLILPAFTLEQLQEIREWILYGDRLLHEWQMDRKLSPGFTALFHGPSGTGKTLAACLLGKKCGCDVYRIDLSQIVSKYIGETEKNLARIFDRAENRQWILFFDEADALFGKRTRVDDAHDRYANQEISFLLQRIEEFHGVVILASNLKANIDDAFMRRLQSVIHFPMPKAGERLRIWSSAFSPESKLEETINLTRIAEKHELSGGTIMNVVRYASLKALIRISTLILQEELQEGIRREFKKEGRNA